MSRMSEAQYELMQDCREKKVTARSARSTRTHCGKSGAVKFPSDYLSAKERKKLNGECKSYRMNAPMTWAEFMSMPDDLKKDYIRAIRQKWNTPDGELAKMFGVSQCTVSNYLRQIGLGLGKNGRKRTWDEKGFTIWRNKVSDSNNITNAIDDAMKQAGDEAEKVSKNVYRPINDVLNEYNAGCGAVPRAGRMTFVGNAEDILKTIKDILKNERVRFTVDWHMVDETGVVNVDAEKLAEAATTLNYAALNEQRKKALGTKG